MSKEPTAKATPKEKVDMIVVVSQLNICEILSPKMGEPMTLERLKADIEANKTMELSLRLYNRLKEMDDFKDELVLSKAFRASVQHFFNKSKSLASTYLHNIRKQIAGGDLYDSNKKWNTKKRDANRAAKAEAAPITPQPEVVADVVEPTVAAIVPSPQVEPTAVNDDDKRWGVMDTESGKVLLKFTSRTQAQQHNADLKAQGQKVRVWDKTKDAASA